jgi:hypothetical protein
MQTNFLVNIVADASKSGEGHMLNMGWERSGSRHCSFTNYCYASVQNQAGCPKPVACTRGSLAHRTGAGKLKANTNTRDNRVALANCGMRGKHCAGRCLGTAHANPAE